MAPYNKRHHNADTEQRISAQQLLTQLVYQSSIESTPKNNKMMIIEDLVNIDDLTNGFVMVSRDAATINDEQFDIAIKYAKHEKDVEGFYSVPVIKHDSDNDVEVLKICLEQFIRYGKNRVFVRTPDKKSDTYLVDTYLDPLIEQSFTPYMTTDLSFLNGKAGAHGKILSRRIERLVEKLKHR